jgi:hypothetical protein
MELNLLEDSFVPVKRGRGLLEGRYRRRQEGKRRDGGCVEDALGEGRVVVWTDAVVSFLGRLRNTGLEIELEASRVA